MDLVTSWQLIIRDCVYFHFYKLGNCVLLDEEIVKHIEFDDLKTLDLACDLDHTIPSLGDKEELQRILLQCKSLDRFEQSLKHL